MGRTRPRTDAPPPRRSLLGGALALAIASAALGEDVIDRQAGDLVEQLLAPAAEPAPPGRRGGGGATHAVEVLRERSDGSPEVRSVARARTAAGVTLRLRFAFDSARIRAEDVPYLLELAEALRDPRLAGSTLSINGHTDAVGDESYNRALSYRRAESVRDFLVARTGLAPARFVVNGYGEAVPLGSNATERQRRRNRRVEIERLR